MARFKVGDRVVCIKEQPRLKKGERGVIKAFGNHYDYIVDFGRTYTNPMDEQEIAHDKEYQVLTILRYVKATRNSL